MSLIKQLWIAIALLMTLAFVSSFIISTHRARAYFEEQLRLKNIDNANSLAMMLSHIDKDPVMLELLIAAQYDTGHYRRIALLNPEGQAILQKHHLEAEKDAGPAWFRRLALLQVEPGVAQIQDGWQQFGTLYLESSSHFAQEALWSTTRNLFLWLLAIAVACGVLGSLLLKFISQPLNSVVDQAEALGERRFIESAVPRTLEFARVVKAMNILSGRIRQTLETEGGRLEEMRRQSQMDPLTGLANRQSLMSVLETLLAHEDRERSHGLLLLRVHDLSNINQRLGYDRANQLLIAVANCLRSTAKAYPRSYTEAHLARLNGSDFTLILSDVTELEVIAADLCQRLVSLAESRQEPFSLLLPQAASYFKAGETRSQVLARLDHLLAVAEQRETTCVELAGEKPVEALFSSSAGWREALHQALAEDGVQTRCFPVRSMDGQLLHREAMMRLTLNGQLRSAGNFIPWARRLGMLPQMDLAMVERVLRDLRQQPVFTAINLSIETLKTTATRLKLLKLLQQQPHETAYLNMELAEQSVINHLEVFLEFCEAVRPLKCGLGLERAGTGFTEINRLQEAGLHYLKIDRSLVHDIAENSNHQNFLRGLCILGHSIGLQLIAEGVVSASDIQVLNTLGLDGVTGPGVQ